LRLEIEPFLTQKKETGTTQANGSHHDSEGELGTAPSH
jgi:hypothetical protein